MDPTPNIFAAPASAPATAPQALPTAAGRLRTWVMLAMAGNLILGVLFLLTLPFAYEEPLAALLVLGVAALHLLMAMEMWTLQAALQKVATGHSEAVRPACAALARFWTVAAVAAVVLTAFSAFLVVVAASV